MTTGPFTALSFAILLGSASAQTPHSTAPHPPRPSREAPPPATEPQAPQPQAPQPQTSQPQGTQPQSPTQQTPDSPSTQPQAPRVSSAPIAGDYRLVTGDKLRVEVYKDTQLSQALQIRPDGKITLPLLGDIVAAGKTPTELRDTLTAALREYITNPVVTVIVVETTPGTVFVMGEVNRPGAQAINGPISILQVLAMAGGFKDFAHTKDIRVLRKSSTGVRTIEFNYNEAIKGNGAPLVLEAGDTVIVP
jgi:polysaccharide biosynthesis/export protein